MVLVGVRAGSELHLLCVLGPVFLVQTQLVRLWVVEIVVAMLVLWVVWVAIRVVCDYQRRVRLT